MTIVIASRNPYTTLPVSRTLGLPRAIPVQCRRPSEVPNRQLGDVQDVDTLTTGKTALNAG
eukprot:9219376-Heterocapsa_arctica.AAC.1